MRALRLQGKASSFSNLTMHPKLPKLSDVLGTRMPNASPESAGVWFRFFSLFDRETFQTGSGCNRDDDNDLPSTDGNGPPQPIPGRPLRADGQVPKFSQHHSVPRGRDFQVRGRDASGQMGKRPDLMVNDKFGDGVEVKKGMGFSGDTLKEKDSRPSINDLFNKSSDSQLSNGQEQSSFLEKFKLSGIGKIEGEEGDATSRPPQEEEEPPQDADLIFKKMKESGLIPNAVAMLDGLCKDGLVNEAMKLFGSMREKGTMPEVVIYTAVVDGFCKAHKFDDAKRIFRKMQSNGITPNAFSYAVLIKGLCKCRKLEEAVDFCVEMLEAGHSLNVTTFTELVDVFCKEKGVEEARSVINALEQKGFYLDEKAVRDHLNKKGPRSSMVWGAVFGAKKSVQR